MMAVPKHSRWLHTHDETEPEASTAIVHAQPVVGAAAAVVAM